VVDYLADYAAALAEESGKATRKMMEMEKKEGLLGLAWLGLRRAGSLFGSAWDGLGEFFEKGVNWLQGEGFVTSNEIADKARIGKQLNEYINTIKVMYGDDGKMIVINEYGEREEYTSYVQRKEAEGALNPDVILTGKRNISKEEGKNIALKEAYKEFFKDGANTLEAVGGIKVEEIKDDKGKIIGFKIQENNGGEAIQTQEYTITGEITHSYYEVKKLDTSKALEYGSRQYIMTLNDLGQTDPNLVQILTLSLNQGENAGLQQELEKAIDKKLIKDIDAAIVRNTACVAATLWINLVLEGANIEEFGEYYAHWANEGKIRAKDAFMTYKDQQAIASYYGYELQRITSYTEFEKFISNSNGVQYGQLQYYNGILESNHNVNLYKYNGGWYVSDVGRMANHGMSWKKVLGDEKFFRYYQYLVRK